LQGKVRIGRSIFKKANKPPAGARQKQAEIFVVMLGQTRQVNTFKIP